ncbi:eCIS core domain-containing protein [Saccharopolyspora flava]|nr:DUF4157 domain-containing protein [Saccharopolyspora flava]
MRLNDHRRPGRAEHETTQPGANARQATTPPAGMAPAPAAILALQRTAGNSAVAAMLSRRSDDAERDTSVQRSAVEQELRKPGRPLGGAVLSEMETRLGADFSEVRVHTGPSAHAAAESVEARAFTSGADIVFQNGHYNTSAAGKHTLAHELTHVLQQRSGPVSGTDRGDGVKVSDPSDAYERAAEANAAEAMRSAPPVQRARDEDAAPSAPPAPVTLQRWAWVGGRRVDPTEDGLSPAMKAHAEDDKVRIYDSREEFENHATGKTDYLGHLEDGPDLTWLRFHPDRVNVVGEKHTDITLPDVLRAVGSNSFVYEAFATGFSKDSKTKSAYLAGLSPVLDRFHGVDLNPDADYTQHGAEPLHPKLAEAMSLLITILNRPTTLATLTKERGSHFGLTAQRYLKMAWGYGKDVKTREWSPLSKNKLKSAYKNAANNKGLKKFMKDLPAEGHIGNAFQELNREESEQYRELLATYLEVLVNEELHRAAPENPDSARNPEDLSPNEKAAELKKIRDERFVETLEAAARNGTRYVGMGGDHSEVLKERFGRDNRFYFVDMRSGVGGPQTLAQFRNETWNRKYEAENRN